MDEALAMVSVDISGRPFCGFTANIQEELINDLETPLVRHFFMSFATTAMITLHVRLFDGEDPHHKVESIFKSFARGFKAGLQYKSGTCRNFAFHKRSDIVLSGLIVLDYGAGNLKSVTNILDKLGCQYNLTNKKEDILAADKIILPGQDISGNLWSP